MPQEPGHLDFGELSENRQQDIDSICNRFESAWRAGSLPRIRDFLIGDSNQSTGEILFRELLRIELEHRRASGDEPGLEEYLREFPSQEAIVRSEVTRSSAPHVPDTTAQSQPGSLTSHDSTLAAARIPAESISPSVSSDSPAQSVPLTSRYQLGSEIARGGMGVVHRATDLAFRREVAIKLLRPRWEQQPDPVVQRHQIAAAIEAFRYEAQITARLQHPGIPPVHELGVLEKGFPFLAMKLIQGRTLQELLDERTDLHADLPRWLQVFEQIAQAVGYAHSHGILHRDLKPLNIMVGEFGEVQVMDWGLAKVLGVEPTAGSLPVSAQAEAAKSDSDNRLYQSEPGDVKGTLQYMPPEQARGEIDQLDARADVFGLGAILCQILTGEPPYTSATKSQLQRDAARGDLDAAVARIRGSGVDPELIELTLRCLALEAQDRPVSGTAVAQAISAYRNQVDLRLRKAETEKARSEQRRLEQAKQRWLWYGIAAILLVMVLYYARSNHIIGKKEQAAKDAALIASQQERAAKAAAKEASDQKNKALNSAETALEVTKFLEDDLLALASPKWQAEQQVTIDPNLKVRDLVLRSADKIETKFKDKPHVEARLRETIGSTLLGLGEYESAIKHQTRALELRKQMGGDEDPLTLAALADLGLAYREAGRLDRAIPMLEEALQLHEKVLGKEDSRTLLCQVNLAGAYEDGGQLERALPLLERALKTQQETLGPAHASVLLTEGNLANTYRSLGQFARAMAMYEESLQRRREKLGPKHPDTLGAMNNLGVACREAGQFQRALTLLKETLERRKEIIGPDHPDTLVTQGNLASAFFSAGQPGEAIALYEATWKQEKEAIGDEHPNTLRTKNTLASLYTETGKADVSLPMLEELFQVRLKKQGTDHPETLLAMNNLALAYRATTQLDRATRLFEETIEKQRTKIGADHLDTLTTMNNLAATYFSAGKFDQAANQFEQVWKARQKKLGAANPLTLVAQGRLATSLQSAGQTERAIPLLEDTLEQLRTHLGPAHPQTLGTMSNLAKAYQESGQTDKAIKLMEEALAGFEKLTGPNSPESLSVRANLAASYHAAGQPKESLPLYEDVLKQLQAKLGAAHPSALGIMNNMAAAYRQTEQPEKALALYQETVDLSTKKLGAAHLETLRPLLSLAQTEIQLKKYTEAEQHLEQLWLHAPKLPPAVAKQFSVATAKAYVALNLLQDKKEDAEKWMKELAQLEEAGPSR